MSMSQWDEIIAAKKRVTAMRNTPKGSYWIEKTDNLDAITIKTEEKYNSKELTKVERMEATEESKDAKIELITAISKINELVTYSLSVKEAKYREFVKTGKFSETFEQGQDKILESSKYYLSGIKNNPNSKISAEEIENIEKLISKFELTLNKAQLKKQEEDKALNEFNIIKKDFDEICKKTDLFLKSELSETELKNY